jgi:hypothetical protein
MYTILKDGRMNGLIRGGMLPHQFLFQNRPLVAVLRAHKGCAKRLSFIYLTSYLRVGGLGLLVPELTLRLADL